MTTKDKLSEAQHSNSQSAPVRYVSKTDDQCQSCFKDNMHVRAERSNGQKGTITQVLECPCCGETYPREVSADRKHVLTDPLTDARALNGPARPRFTDEE